MLQMGEFLGIPEEVIEKMIIEADTNKDGQISQEEWVKYVELCKEEEKDGKKFSLVEQLNKEETIKIAATTLRIDNRMNMFDTNIKLNNEEINYAKEIAKNTVNQ